MDGVPAFTQCPIPPGHSFTYRFKAELYGTTWYHAHYSAQYADGAMGPLIIHGPKNIPYDVDLGPIMLSDWYHSSYLPIVRSVVRPSLNPPIPTSDNNLINGKMNFNCSQVPSGNRCTNNAGLSKFKFQTGKTHRLRLINSGADGAQQFTIDEHVMTVMANDFVPVQPYKTTVVTLGVGQRTDVIVKATGSPSGAYWMRSNITCASSNQHEALAVIYYDKSDTTSVPKSTGQSYSPGCFNERVTSAYLKAGMLTWPTGSPRSDRSVVPYSSR
jgi:FtsP/CotA-like multicopper oxidase with cupredoxin domain